MHDGEVIDLLEAFWRLDRDRPYLGMEAVPGMIPYRSVIDFARWHGIGEGDQFEEFYAAIAAMDRERIALVGRQKQMASQGQHFLSEQPMTMQLFDALFG